MLKKIVCTIGTRPEAIKMVPVILALKNEPWAEVRVLATAQHRHMLDQMLDFFGIESDIIYYLSLTTCAAESKNECS